MGRSDTGGASEASDMGRSDTSEARRSDMGRSDTGGASEASDMGRSASAGP